ncbi:MAG: type I-B CRISPR-associated protein Cas7/Csh2 [Bacteroidales bacterium]|nr:type I-B CRISPR-associated protein Cas7/Csh2 [Bacteroidales bacterium]
METIKNRSEIVFLYDMKLNNPNGDPMNGNAPRIDEETGRCLVTDVRLKRTVRDYLFEKGYNGTDNKDIFIREIVKDGFTKDVKTRSKDFIIPNNKNEDENEIIQKYKDGKIKTDKLKSDEKRKIHKILIENARKNILLQNIDIRLFGGTLAQDIINKDSITFTGPVQFGMGFSLNKVQQKSIAHSFVMASRDDATSGSLAEENIIKYGLFGFHGVINENAAFHTDLKNPDVEELLDGLWNGTKNLLTRSKKGQMPRLLIKIDYKPGFFIGDLVEKLKLIPNEGINKEDYTDITDFTIDTSDLISTLRKYKGKIIGIKDEIDDRVKLSEKIPTLEQLKSEE